MSETKFPVRLFIDTKTKKFLFAEGRKEFIDFLYCLLYLPIGTISRLLKDEGTLGSIGSLCKTLKNSDSLEGPPACVDIPLLFPNQIVGSYLNLCSSNNCRTYYINNYASHCPVCGNFMVSGRIPTAWGSKALNSEGDSLKYKQAGLYMVDDDLSVKPLTSVTSIVSWLRSNVKDLNAVEEREVYFGRKEGIKLLKASLESKEVLTNVFIEEKRVK